MDCRVHGVINSLTQLSDFLKDLLLKNKDKFLYHGALRHQNGLAMISAEVEVLLNYAINIKYIKNFFLYQEFKCKA